MFKRSNERLELIVDVAAGKRSIDDLGEISGSELSRIESLKAIIQFLEADYFAAPQSAISNAINIMASQQKRLTWNRSLPFKSALAARSAVAQHAFTFEEAGYHLRLVYSESNEGWEVVGKITPESWMLVIGDEFISPEPSGHFQLHVESLDHPPFTFTQRELAIEVANAKSLLENDQ